MPRDLGCRAIVVCAVNLPYFVVLNLLSRVLGRDATAGGSPSPWSPTCHHKEKPLESARIAR